MNFFEPISIAPTLPLSLQQCSPFTTVVISLTHSFLFSVLLAACSFGGLPWQRRFTKDFGAARRLEWGTAHIDRFYPCLNETQRASYRHMTLSFFHSHKILMGNILKDWNISGACWDELLHQKACRILSSWHITRKKMSSTTWNMPIIRTEVFWEHLGKVDGTDLSRLSVFISTFFISAIFHFISAWVK